MIDVSQLPQHECGLYIVHNGHKCFYETVEEAIKSGTYEASNFIDEEEMAACIAENEAWELQWYPYTPIGFYVVIASTFERAVEAAREVKE